MKNPLEDSLVIAACLGAGAKQTVRYLALVAREATKLGAQVDLLFLPGSQLGGFASYEKLIAEATREAGDTRGMVVRMGTVEEMAEVLERAVAEETPHLVVWEP